MLAPCILILILIFITSSKSDQEKVKEIPRSTKYVLFVLLAICIIATMGLAISMDNRLYKPVKRDGVEVWVLE